MNSRALMSLLLAAFALLVYPVKAGAADSYTNSLGMKMIKIDAGSFRMGRKAGPVKSDWDEKPVHRVAITSSFYISQTEVTVEQYRQFRPDARINKDYTPCVAGISWNDARAFCQWLSRKEGRKYRLPTEAEWEYACRAGTKTPFWSGDQPPEKGTPNPWGLKNMHSGVREWCEDWYGQYPVKPQADPVGRAAGMTKVVRGGGLDRSSNRYFTSTNRAALPPSFAPYPHPEKKEKKQKDVSEKPTETGLVGVKFNHADLSEPQNKVELDEVDLSYGDSSCSLRLIGCIQGRYDGRVTFTAEAQDGLRLKIAETLVIDGWGKNAARKGTFTMQQGVKYPVEITYFQNEGGPAYLRLYWARPGQERELVPAEALWHSEADEKYVKDKFSDAHRGPFGTHPVGFRVVEGRMPRTEPLPYEPPFVTEGVKQNTELAGTGPDLTEPYYRKRFMLPTPPENQDRQEIDAAGLHPAFREHNHSPGFEVCPNGDLLLVIYTSYHEYEPGVSLMATRLRFGTQRWDMPAILLDFVDMNDHAPMLWTEDGRIYLFWGNPAFRSGRAFPFNWTTSTDNGASWSEIKFPHFKGIVGRHSKQPINTAIRDREGTLYVASDGGAMSLIWATENNGKTWYDTGGRTGGRHTTFVLRKDGSILGMGGKNTDIDGYMPRSVSYDGGKTWKVSKTQFASLGSNQRPCITRLHSGRLCFVSDFQDPGGNAPAGITRRGSFVALSDDEGKTWTVKKLIGTQKHENRNRLGGADTLGYSAVRQAPNGLIHVITTMNRPCLHFAFNEAWVFDENTRSEYLPDSDLMEPSVTSIKNVTKYTENYPSGKPRHIWHGGIGDNGRFLLHGKELWFYENGHKKYQAEYLLGEKIGIEMYWSVDGRKKWQWEHRPDGTDVYTTFWPNGNTKSRSYWRNFRCSGKAQTWDPAGNRISCKEFFAGSFVGD